MIIRIEAGSIRICARPSKGVRVMKVNEGSKVITMARAPHDDEEEISAVEDDGSAEEAKKTFHDLRGVFTEEQMKKETERCLGCGAVVLNEDQCIGCGICTTKCEFDAIHLKRNRPQNSKMIPAEDKFKAIGPYAAKRQVKIIKKKLSGK